MELSVLENDRRARRIRRENPHPDIREYAPGSRIELLIAEITAEVENASETDETGFGIDRNLEEIGALADRTRRGDLFERDDRGSEEKAIE